MMGIKAVVFDYGGVICFPPPPEIEAEIGRLCGVPLTVLRDLNRKYRGEYDRGTYTSRDYYRFILTSAGVSPDDSTLEKIIQTDQDGWSRINPGTIQLMADIKAAGFTLGILSNMPHEFLAWARKNIPVFTETDPAVFSCEYNLIKPEAAIYAKLKELSACEYQEIVFFDDTQDNIAAAATLGIQGFVWEGPEAARRILKNCGRAFEGL